jgi:hypothetical protein
MPGLLRYPTKGRLNVSSAIHGIAHLEGIGDVEFLGNEWVGTRDQERRLEGFSLNIDPPIETPNGTMNIYYQGWVENIGLMPAVQGPAYLGTRGRGLHLEAFSIYVLPNPGMEWSCQYAAWEQDKGLTGVFSEGAWCGSTGLSRRLEAMIVDVLPRGEWLDPGDGPPTTIP